MLVDIIIENLQNLYRIYEAEVYNSYREPDYLLLETIANTQNDSGYKWHLASKDSANQNIFWYLKKTVQ